MKNIIISPNIAKINEFIRKCPAEYSFIVLGKRLGDKSGILKDKGLKEIGLYDASGGEKLNYEREYISIIGALGHEEVSVDWWANQVSEKNEHLSTLYQDLCEAVSLKKMVNGFTDNETSLIILTDSNRMCYLVNLLKKSSLNIILLRNPVLEFITNAIESLCDAARILHFLFKMLCRKTIATYYLRNKITQALQRKGNVYVLRTWLDGRYLKQSAFYTDAYFGMLPKWLAQKGKDCVILAGIIGEYRTIIKKICADNEFCIIPEEYYLRCSDFVRILKKLRFRRTRLKKKIFFRNIDVTGILDDEITSGYRNTYYVSALMRYYIARNCAKEVDINAFVLTYENYGWEKMTVLGVRESSPGTSISGFQHAFVSRNSFKYFPDVKEKDTMPLPDKIITMGKTTGRIMREYGSYEKGIIRTGCALRQSYLADARQVRRKRSNRILVPLTTVKSEAVSIINFIYESGIHAEGIETVIRCHPVTPFEKFNKYIQFDLPKNYIIDNGKSVSEQLENTDMVLYTGTTVAVEAFKMGIPVIFLDVLSPLYVDSLFECDYFRKFAKEPKDLVPAIHGFYNMDDSKYYSEQQAAQNYLKEYFYPVTEENLAAFCG